jgi:spore maturation protein CgeB
MKIFYAGAEYDHFDPKRGTSFEHENFYTSLKAYPSAEVTYFKFERILEIGREKFNAEILAAARREKPDLFFAFMYSEELDPAMLAELKKETRTMAWFADDSWRFYNYSKFWAKHFTWAITTYSYMPALYKAAGQPNVIRSQWAANTAHYKPRSKSALAEVPDVAFVGGWSAPRGQIVERLKRKGIPVKVYGGGGWPDAKRVSEEEMLELFSLSKINLGLNPPPGLWSQNTLGRWLFRPTMNKVALDLHLAANINSWRHMTVPQIKARHFQIPACGGFVMTSMADDLGEWYVPGKEIVIYENEDDMAEKVKYYLAHEAERKAIAQAGYERTVRDHTYEKRFRAIFQAAGL